MHAYPPMRSKLTNCAETDYQLLLRKHLARNEKARLRMRRKRAELKSRPQDEQIAANARQRRYQAKYRNGKREKIRFTQHQRRLAAYKAIYGPAAFAEYCRALQQRRMNAELRQQAREPYDSDMDDFEEFEDELCSSGDEDSDERESSSSPLP
ncbi:hypothetical protein R3P38DRAFT_3199261 [Favolaschia claudopus]|uniref:Uncharacterized protein n=1 Tax=Favolaschia claudopus TaxID=2862362 RepID=A0AAW0B4X7_9AGAR